MVMPLYKYYYLFMKTFNPNHNMILVYIFCLHTLHLSPKMKYQNAAPAHPQKLHYMSVQLKPTRDRVQGFHINPASQVYMTTR